MNYERLAARMQQRFAETVAKYEGDFALFQERATLELERLQEEVAELSEKLREAELALATQAEEKDNVSPEDD